MSKTAIDAARSAYPSLSWQEKLFLLEHVTGKPVPELAANQTPLTSTQEELFLELLGYRKAGIPLAALIGSIDFLDFRLKVMPWVFIPRPETEQLVLRTIEELDGIPNVILELGTGTGAIAIALARRFPQTRIIATDLSPIALELAGENAETLGASGRIGFLKANLFDFKAAEELEGKVDLLISNPPYIPTDRLALLPAEVGKFDPPLSLNGGPDGFRVVERILDGTSRFLAPKGLAAIEIDPVLKEPLKRYARTSSLVFKTGVDTYGNLRFLFVRLTA